MSDQTQQQQGGEARQDKAGQNGSQGEGRAQQAAYEGTDRAEQVRQRATEAARDGLRSSIEIAADGARRMSSEMERGLGLAGKEGDALAEQSARNVEAISRTGTVIAIAMQDISRHWMTITQGQIQRNLDGVNRLAQCRSLGEMASVQSDLMRDGMRSVLEESRSVTEIAARAVERAGRTIAEEARA